MQYLFFSSEDGTLAETILLPFGSHVVLKCPVMHLSGMLLPEVQFQILN